MQTLSLSQPYWIIGHRGAAGEALENTLESFLLAINQGADMIELDLQLTRDSQLVAFHDWGLERLAGERSVVEASSLSCLQQVAVRDTRSERPQRVQIPSLQEVLAELPGALPLNLELKRRTADPVQMATALAGSIRGRSQILVSSFDWKLLEEVKQALPDCPLAPIGREEPRALLEAADRLGAFSIHCSRRIADRDIIEAAVLQGRPLLVYTVTEAQEARRLFGWGVKGVFTDFPGRLRRGLQE